MCFAFGEIASQTRPRSRLHHMIFIGSRATTGIGPRNHLLRRVDNTGQERAAGPAVAEHELVLPDLFPEPIGGSEHGRTVPQWG